MPSYTLYYFNGRGRAEICRLLFAAAAVQHTDKRIEHNEWDQWKSKMPTASLPMLEVDSKQQFPQSMSIARYLAREFGFHAKTNVDMARVEYITDCLYEILDDYMKMYHEKNGKLSAQSGQKFGDKESKVNELTQRYQETCRRILPFLEKTLEIQNIGCHFFMGDQLMLCDMMCYAALENPVLENPSLLSSYPRLQALRNCVASHPKLATYLKKRNASEF